MKKEYTFSSLQSGKVIVTIDNNKITIKRKGLLAFARYGLKGEKTIMINQISSIQLKKTGMTIGYLQFCIIGSQESKGSLRNAMYDENTIVFDGSLNKEKEMNKQAEEIKEYIENFNSKNGNYDNTNKYDDLSKLKQMLDNNIITEEEFKKEKDKILNK